MILRAERREGLGLGYGTGETVEQPALRGVGLGQALADEPDGQLVRYEAARLDDRLDLEP